MKCWKVKCVAKDGAEYEVGVMCSDEAAAKRCAEHSLREGRHVDARAVSAEVADGI